MEECASEVSSQAGSSGSDSCEALITTASELAEEESRADAAVHSIHSSGSLTSSDAHEGEAFALDLQEQLTA